MTTYTDPVLFWWLTIFVTVLLVLIIPAAIIESPITERWLRRLHKMQEGRARQERERDREAEERRRAKISEAAEWVYRNTWSGR